MKIYAVICNGSAEGLQDALAIFDAPASCLYNEPIDPNTFRNAPFLVEVTESFKPWLAEQTTPWGLYLLTQKEVTFNELRQHLRRYTYAKIPSEEVPVLFRFYDPRVFWDFAEVIDDWNLHAMLGPIEIVASHYGELKQDHFEERRRNYPKNAKMRGMFLTLTVAQEAALNSKKRDKYIQELTDHMWAYVDPNHLTRVWEDPEEAHAAMLRHQRDVKGIEITHPEDLKLLEKVFSEKKRDPETGKYLPRTIEEMREAVYQLAKDFHQFCVGEGIKDDRSLKELTWLIAEHNIFSFDDIPQEWRERLRDKKDDEIGKYRARRLSGMLKKALKDNEERLV